MFVARTVLVVSVWCLGLCAAIRVDDKKHFRLCDIPQAAQLDRVEVQECNRWPCLVRAGQSGTYHVTFTQHTNEVMRSIKSDIYAWVKLAVNDKNNKPIRVPMPGERGRQLCGYANPGCPVYPGVPTTITKTINIPAQARAAQGQVLVEFQVTDERKNVLVCFKAPVIVA
ncbi:uncharacterized protein [Panulirus ornatus]|uniref:uncharacterized protein n=1 Tax=Panulirus ornatus TaxID=150431 RepID=UPI003A84A3F5